MPIDNQKTLIFLDSNHRQSIKYYFILKKILLFNVVIDRSSGVLKTTQSRTSYSFSPVHSFIASKQRNTTNQPSLP